MAQVMSNGQVGRATQLIGECSDKQVVENVACIFKPSSNIFHGSCCRILCGVYLTKDRVIRLLDQGIRQQS